MNFRMPVRLIMPLFLLLSSSAFTQTTREEKKKAGQEQRAAERAQLKANIDARQYSFFAQTATALDGKLFQLSSLYFLKIHQDSLDADLPYYGRAYAATLGNTNGGIRFKSTSFSYGVKDLKKGGWFITIVPENNRNANKMELSIDQDGYASLEVSSTYRESISFRGEIRPNSNRP